MSTSAGALLNRSLVNPNYFEDILKSYVDRGGGIMFIDEAYDLKPGVPNSHGSTIYNMLYRDGKGGATYVKRFNVTSTTRDREYDMTKGKKGSQNKTVTLTANTTPPNTKLLAIFKSSC